MGLMGGRRRRFEAVETRHDSTSGRPLAEAPPLSDTAWSWSENPDLLPVIGPRRAGRYEVHDAQGHLVGTIRGDYVIGFTVSCWGHSFRVGDLAEASARIAEYAVGERAQAAGLVGEDARGRGDGPVARSA